MRTYVYVDGFNLYYGAVKSTAYKWLDLKALFQKTLEPHHEILAIKYYTAMISARPDDPDAPTRQTTYLDALKAHIPELSITLGHFLSSEISMRLAHAAPDGSKYAKVLKTEEKGSDVNLALHVLNDAWHDRYDCAVICSNDSDLAEALRLVKMEHKKMVILAVPGDPKMRRANNQLKRWARPTLRIDPAVVADSQLPNPIPGTSLHKPPNW
jgi:uncharacterized LabA/DUF88 family protein